MAKKKNDELALREASELALTSRRVVDEQFNDDMANKSDKDASDENLSEFKFVSNKGGVFWVGQEDSEENTMIGIIVGNSHRRTLYTEKYDPDSPAPPACFAVGHELSVLKAHETVPAKKKLKVDGRVADIAPETDCQTCPFGNFVDNAKPVCSQNRQLALIPLDVDFDDLDNKTKVQYLKEGRTLPIESDDGGLHEEFPYREKLINAEEEIWMAKLPPTSLKAFSKFLKSCQTIRRSYDSLVVRISLDLNNSGSFPYYEWNFEIIDRLDPSEYQLIQDRHETIEEGVLRPLDLKPKDPKPKGKSGAGKARNSRKR